MANSNNWGEIYKSTWWGDEDWSANSLKIDSAPPGFAGQNLLLGSEELEQSDEGEWERLLMNAVNANQVNNPEGTEQTADQLDFQASKAARIQQDVTLVAGTEYTFSVWARAASGTQPFRLRYYDNVGGSGGASAFTASATWSPTTGRYSFTFTAANSGTFTMMIQNAADAASRRIYFWGAMLNEGATAGDYIKTTFIGPSSPATPPMEFGDNFVGVTAYYSLRRFTIGEDNNAIRVRRSSDDTEQDIGFDSNGDLDTTALLAFVNAEITDDINTTTDSNSDGLADGLSKLTNNATATIVTGNGHIGSAQRMEYNVGGGTLQSIGIDTLNTLIGQEITVSFMYRSNISFSLGNGNGAAGGDFNSIPANTGDAIRYEVKAIWSPAGGLDGRLQPMWLDSSGEFIEISDWSVTYHTADGAVTTFYDQTGNGNDATNSTASEQPLVVSAGTLVTENSKAAIDFDGVDDAFTISVAITAGFSIFGVYKNTKAASYLIGGTPQLGRRSNDQYRFHDATFSANGGAHSDSQVLLTGIEDGTEANIYANGTQIPAGLTTSTFTSGTLTLISSANIDGTIQELIVFNSDQSANRTGIETNINDYFDIYTP